MRGCKNIRFYSRFFAAPFAFRAFFTFLEGIGKNVQNGQTEPEGVCIYSER